MASFQGSVPSEAREDKKNRDESKQIKHLLYCDHYLLCKWHKTFPVSCNTESLGSTGNKMWHVKPQGLNLLWRNSLGKYVYLLSC